MPNERDALKREIDKYLKSLAPHVWFRKTWGGGLFGHEGDPDYLVCAWGRFIAIEAKHPTTGGRSSPSQILAARRIHGAGGFVTTVRSVDDVEFLMNEVETVVERMNKWTISRNSSI